MGYLFIMKFLFTFVGFVFSTMSFAEEPSLYNMPVGVTEISKSIYDLHMLIFYVCCIIAVVVFSIMGYSLINHRKKQGSKPATFHDNLSLEIVWTIIPVLILIGMAIPATRVLIEMYDTGNEDLLIEVRGYQWKWQYKYLDQDYNETVSFFSNLATPQDEILGRSTKGEFYLVEVDEPLVIPTGKKVRFLLTSQDVIHAWWVPEFGIKRDAVPGIVNELWTIVNKPGVYRGQCTELCGKDHGFMPIVVRALPEDEFNVWFKEKQAKQKEIDALNKMTFTHEELMAKGKVLYEKHCAACHGMQGKGTPPIFPPIAGYVPALKEHVNTVYYGVKGTAMQGFGSTGQLSLAEIAQVVHYERHAFGNNAGDILQPKDVRDIVKTQ